MNKMTVSFVIHESLWKRFKQKCLDDNKTVAQVLGDFIREYSNEKSPIDKKG